jgi:hypothetical protein
MLSPKTDGIAAPKAEVKIKNPDAPAATRVIEG